MSTVRDNESAISSLEKSSTSTPIIEDLYSVMRWKIPRAVIIYFGILLTASVYSNLQPLSFMLTKMGAYFWLCEPESVVDGKCDEQSLYIETIYNIGANMEYVVGFVAGFTLDLIGAQWTAGIGVGMIIVGWGFFAMSSEALQLYWPAFILLGSACNLIGFPGFLVGNFFPGWINLGASLCIAMQMLSSFLMQAMWAISDKIDPALIKWVFVGYIGTFTIPSVGMIGALPSRKYLKAPTKVSEDWKRREYWVVYAKYCVEWRFLLFTAWYILLTMCYSIFNTTIRRHAGDEVSGLVGILNPVRAILGPIQGLLADYIGIFPVFFVNNALVVIFFIFTLIGAPATDAAGDIIQPIQPNGWNYTAVVFYIVGRAFVFTTKYCFVLEFYPEEHFGKLSGALSLASGLFGFIVSIIINIDKSTTYMNTVFMIVGIAMAIIPIFLFMTSGKWSRFAKYGPKERSVSDHEESVKVLQSMSDDNNSDSSSDSSSSYDVAAQPEPITV